MLWLSTCAAICTVWFDITGTPNPYGKWIESCPWASVNSRPPVGFSAVGNSYMTPGPGRMLRLLWHMNSRDISVSPSGAVITASNPVTHRSSGLDPGAIAKRSVPIGPVIDL